MKNTLSIYGSHDASVTFIDNTGKIRVLEYERFVKQRYAAFTKKMENRNGLGTDDTQRREFLQYIKNHINGKITTVLYNELVKSDLDIISEYFPNVEFKVMEHHMSHAACGFYQSKFEEALIVSIDGGGVDYDGVTTTRAYFGSQTTIDSIKKIDVNLGVVYSSLGAPISEVKAGPDSDRFSLVYAGKLMGLCAYGTVRKDWLTAMRVFYYTGELSVLGKSIGLNLSMNNISGQNSYDLAATSQFVFEERTFEILIPLLENYSFPNVVLVGGCALNVLFNQKLADYLISYNSELYVPPNPNDCGLSLGQFLLEHPHHTDTLTYNGFKLLDIDELDVYIDEYNAIPIDVMGIVTLLKSGNIIGMVTGDSEIGPRALGNRSIICDPSFPDMKDTLNAKVKFREWFRPFAPVCRLLDSKKYFNDVFDSPCMSHAPTINNKYKVELSSITHADNTARLQTTTETQHIGFYDILTELDNQQYIPVILNTSFNIRGLPILTTIADALYALENTKMDYVIINGFLFSKK
tara:strand:+ start:2466 stop:4031 length:1566 start_codon:yes stop_codon:yes gene_type:complete